MKTPTRQPPEIKLISLSAAFISLSLSLHRSFGRFNFMPLDLTAFSSVLRMFKFLRNLFNDKICLKIQICVERYYIYETTYVHNVCMLSISINVPSSERKAKRGFYLSPLASISANPLPTPPPPYPPPPPLHPTPSHTPLHLPPSRPTFVYGSASSSLLRL